MSIPDACDSGKGRGNLAAAALASDLRGHGQVEALGLGAVGMKASDPRGTVPVRQLRAHAETRGSGAPTGPPGVRAVQYK